MPRAPKPSSAPEGTVWFGGDVERVRVCVRVLGDELNPDEITAILGHEPTRLARKGDPVLRANGEVIRLRRIGSWLLDHTPAAEVTVDEAITEVLGKLAQDPAIWQSLATRFRVELICDMTVRGVNQGFVLSPMVLQEISARGISLGVDIFTELDVDQAAGLAERFRRPEE